LNEAGASAYKYNETSKVFRLVIWTLRLLKSVMRIWNYWIDIILFSLRRSDTFLEKINEKDFQALLGAQRLSTISPKGWITIFSRLTFQFLFRSDGAKKYSGILLCYKRLTPTE